uniref:Uncharacterized protein n=1 Tax=Rhizophora mucronata TaxID=61149 RepID=A0A2P2N6S9_RHIMU
MLILLLNWIADCWFNACLIRICHKFLGYLFLQHGVWFI